VGKSTLASKLASQLDATVVPGDDFFIGGVVVRNEDPATLFDACIDWQAARDVLHDLIEFGEAQLHRAEDWYLSMVISWDDFHFVMDSERLVEVRKS
jgi:uridine kinase